MEKNNVLPIHKTTSLLCADGEAKNAPSLIGVVRVKLLPDLPSLIGVVRPSSLKIMASAVLFERRPLECTVRVATKALHNAG